MAKQKPKLRFIDVIVIDPFTVQFCALSVILLAFFILLNSMAVIDSERKREVIGSLIGTFGSMPGGEQENPDVGMLESPRLEVTDEELNELTVTLANVLGDNDLEGDVEIFIRDTDIVIRVEGKALFAPGEDRLLHGAVEILHDIAETLRTSERHITIEGHTDPESVPHSRYATSWIFAAARAARVHDVFLRDGIEPQRMSVASLGDTEPCMPNYTDFQRSLNRRVDIVVEEGATDPDFRPRTRTINIVPGVEIDVENAPPDGIDSWEEFEIQGNQEG